MPKSLTVLDPADPVACCPPLSAQPLSQAQAERVAPLLKAPADRAALRVLFVYTANSARSHLAAALWRRASAVPAVSAGTHPAEMIDAGAIAAAQRHHLPRLRPRHVSDVRHDGDLIITVCDLAHEELGEALAVYWSIPDLVPAGDPGSFDAVLAQIADRVGRLAPRLAAVS